MENEMERFCAEGFAGEKNRDGPVEAANAESSFDDAKPQTCITVPHYSELEANILAEKLANKESYKEARQVLITWIERGECNESNSTSFFSLIKLCFKFVKKLQMEQKECVKKVEIAEEKLANQNCLIQCDLNKIGNAFEAIEKQGIWDNFTQSERKNIQMMKKDFLDLKQDNLMDVVKERYSMNFKNVGTEIQMLKQQTYFMQSKLNSLRAEAEALKIKKEANEKEILLMRAELERRKNVNASSEGYARQNETQIICLISSLLVDHFVDGLSLDYIYAYIRYFNPTIHIRNIEYLLRRFPALFEEIGFGPERTWVFVGFGN